MVPEAFHEYCVASTGAAAALVGLLDNGSTHAPKRFQCWLAEQSLSFCYIACFASLRKTRRGMCDAPVRRHQHCVKQL